MGHQFYQSHKFEKTHARARNTPPPAYVLLSHAQTFRSKPSIFADIRSGHTEKVVKEVKEVGP